MAGFSTDSNEHLIRTNLWSNQLKEVLQDELFAQKYVNWVTDFNDGTTLNIPSIGEAEVLNYGEGQAVQYQAMDTGNFTLTVTDYKSSATYITAKMKQDSYYVDRLVSGFVPKMNRALSQTLEQAVLGIPDATGGQTNDDPNLINGARHKQVGSGTNETISIEDFAKARYALQKANVPMKDLVCIVDPSVEHTLNTLTNIVNVSNNPQMGGVLATSMNPTGMKFLYNIMGFDIWVSQNLHEHTTDEVISTVTATSGVSNLFFSASADVTPFIGVMRQPPKVDHEWNKDLQRDEYVTTMRYGVKLYRPENLFTLVTDNDQVYA
jgi:hypothetical protein